MRYINKAMAAIVFALAVMLLTMVGIAIHALTVDYAPVNQDRITQHHIELCQSAHQGEELLQCLDSIN